MINKILEKLPNPTRIKKKYRVAPDTDLAGYPANILPDIRYPAK